MFYNLFLAQTAYAESGVDKLLKSLNKQILNPLIGALFAIALAYFIYGVVKFILDKQQGKADEAGKQHMVWGLVGLFIMAAVFGILQFIANSLDVALNAKEGTTGGPVIGSTPSNPTPTKDNTTDTITIVEAAKPMDKTTSQVDPLTTELQFNYIVTFPANQTPISIGYKLKIRNPYAPAGIVEPEYSGVLTPGNSLPNQPYVFEAFFNAQGKTADFVSKTFEVTLLDATNSPIGSKHLYQF